MSAVIGLGVCAAAHAVLYVYELPGGTRVRTDHELDAPHYRLVRSGERPDDVLHAAARDDIGESDSVQQGERLQNEVRRAALKEGRRYSVDPSAYDELIKRIASEHDVDFALVKAVVHVESSFNPHAKSRKGARGLMQLMPATARHYGIEDIHDPVQNLSAGVKHLRYLLTRFRHQRKLALAAYNAGETAVRRHRGIPPYPETRAYVRKVMQYQRRYGGTS